MSSFGFPSQQQQQESKEDFSTSMVRMLKPLAEEESELLLFPRSNSSSEDDNNIHNNIHNNNNPNIPQTTLPVVLDDNNNNNNQKKKMDENHPLEFPSPARINSVATLSSPWQYDSSVTACSGCQSPFHALNRRHHCRLCGKVFCGSCTGQRSLIPPSSIVLFPRKKKATLDMNGDHDEEDDDPDRMFTYLTPGRANQLLYGKGLEERFKLAREPLRVCQPCTALLAPLQEDLRASNSNAMRFNHIDPTDPRRLFNSPIANTLGHEIRKAAYTLNNLLPQPRRMGPFLSTPPPTTTTITSSSQEPLGFQKCKEVCLGISPNLGDWDGVRIPATLLEQAQGIAVMTVMKGGLGLAGFEFGTGLVVARTASGGWSAPSAIGLGGIAWGALIGAQVADHVFLLMNPTAVRMLFSDSGSVQLGADVGIAVGPLGRAVEGNLGASPGKHVAPIYTYSLSKGLYAGVSLDGKVICTRQGVNEKFYGRPVTALQILAGDVPLPPAAQPLYEALARCHVYASSAQQETLRPLHHPLLMPPTPTTMSLQPLPPSPLLLPEEGDWMLTPELPIRTDSHSHGDLSDMTTDTGF